MEAKRVDLEISIAKEKIQKSMITHEQIVFWISRFKDGNIDDPQYRRDIVDAFVNSVFLYDDRLVLMYNYKDGAKTVSLSQIECSDLGQCSPAV